MTVYKKVLTQNGFVNHHELNYPFEERGLQFGDGVYEVIRVYNGTYYLLNSHLERLYRSAQAIKLQVPFTKEELYENIYSLLEKNSIQTDAKVYLQVTRGSARRDHAFPNVKANLYAYVEDMPRPIHNLQTGVATITHKDVRWDNCYIKSLNLLPNVLAKQEANENGCFEAILYKNGKVTECSASNVYIVANGTIYTHPETNNILHGCVRSKLKTLANELHIPLKEETFSLTELINADEVFLSSSTSEIMPIIEIDQKVISSGKPGPFTKKLQQAYEQDANIQTSIFSSSSTS